MITGGQVQFMGESIPQAANYHKQGKVRALAVTSKERNPALRGRALSITFLGMSISYAVGVPVGAWLGFEYGWRCRCGCPQAPAA